MEFVHFSWIDYALFISMFGLSSAVGIYFGCCGRQTTTNDYLLGGKRMHFFPVSMSLVASTLSGVTLLGIPAEIYMHGMQISLMALSLIIVGFITNFVFLPVFYNLQLTTANDYLELRFDKSIKTFASLLYVVAAILFLPVVVYAPSLAFNQVSGFDLHIIAPIMSVICIFYTTIGGLKAVVWTDTLQFCVTLTTLIFVLVMGTISVGGLGPIWEKSTLGERLEFFNLNPDPTVRNTFWSVTIGYTFCWAGLFSTNPSAVQRFLALPSLTDAKKSLTIFVIFTALTKLISCFSGLIMYTKYFNCDPLSMGLMKKADQIVPYYVLDVASRIPGLSGLFVAGLFSTALSTLSTVLNTLSGVIYSDFLAPYMPKETSERRASNIMKLLTVLMGILSICLIFVIEKLGTVLELFHCVNGMTGGPALGLFTLGMLFPCANKIGALIGGLTSLLLMALIIIKNQIYVWNGLIQFVPKPLGTSECNGTNLVGINGTLTSMEDEPFWLFRISFQYYYAMGVVVTIIVGLIVSCLTKDKKSSLNPSLFGPCVRRFLSEEQSILEVTKSDEVTYAWKENT